jgi:hypothetical protein
MNQNVRTDKSKYQAVFNSSLPSTGSPGGVLCYLRPHHQQRGLIPEWAEAFPHRILGLLPSTGCATARARSFLKIRATAQRERVYGKMVVTKSSIYKFGKEDKK